MVKDGECCSVSLPDGSIMCDQSWIPIEHFLKTFYRKNRHNVIQTRFTCLGCTLQQDELWVYYETILPLCMQKKKKKVNALKQQVLRCSCFLSSFLDIENAA